MKAQRNKLCENEQYEFKGFWYLNQEEFETYIPRRFSKQKFLRLEFRIWKDHTNNYDLNADLNLFE